MEKKLVMSLNDSQLAVMVNWCKANNIPYDVIDSNPFANGLPSLTSSSTSATETKNTVTKKQYVTTKGLKDVRYTLTKVGSLYCISRGAIDENGKYGHGGWTKSEKACINNAIKSLKGIKEQKKEVEYKTWGYDTKKKAQEMMATLPTEFSAEEIAKFDSKK